ncbi:hypothetical protein EIN_080580 [Entamoeba invadens IP1]|uniref:hypothetical protein n=1 Tax=Entamoeba invadens IP1 TaxID=370355 RepID=UPI0002C3F0B6|nr:hypothetical protein EIN_080580 [Entamoeba invadens IP1]ELP85086.1 hypothetical protein EIN_080580 [Entamoeba invadens IP1]|eukprot:XP_004184432.1 hypothetical protein EIN_080580 [Entamoeba invadens IP1]
MSNSDKTKPDVNEKAKKRVKRLYAGIFGNQTEDNPIKPKPKEIVENPQSKEKKIEKVNKSNFEKFEIQAGTFAQALQTQITTEASNVNLTEETAQRLALMEIERGKDSEWKQKNGFNQLCKHERSRSNSRERKRKTDFELRRTSRDVSRKKHTRQYI